MTDAVSAVRNTGMGRNKAQKIFNVPKTSLRRYVNMKLKNPEKAVQTKSGRKPAFSAEMEKDFVVYLLFMETRLFGLTRQNIRRLAFQLAIRNNLKNKFLRLRAPLVKTCCKVSSTDTKALFHYNPQQGRPRLHNIGGERFTANCGRVHECWGHTRTSDVNISQEELQRTPREGRSSRTIFRCLPSGWINAQMLYDWFTILLEPRIPSEIHLSS
jgi:hypothetical protein